MREKILINLLGDKVIHIRFTKGAPKTPGTLRHAICHLSQSGQCTAQEAVCTGMTECGEVPPDHNSSYMKRHESCACCGDRSMIDSDKDRKALLLDLSVLGVSRQLYEEANYLLWATNIFSFDYALSFDKFLASLNVAQKHNLTKLHIRMNFNPRYEHGHSWRSALKIPYLKTLKSVQQIYLCNSLVLYGYQLGSDEEILSKCAKRLDNDIEPFLRLRVLPQRHVIFKIHEIQFCGYPDHATKTIALVDASKEEIQANICTRLMNPQGAELVKADEDAAKLKALQQAVHYNRYLVKRALKRTSSLEISAAERREIAQNAKAAAKRTAATAKRATNEGRSNAKRLRSQARLMAQEVPGSKADQKSSQYKFEAGQKKLKEKEEKLARAVSRLAEFEKKIGVSTCEPNNNESCSEEASEVSDTDEGSSSSEE